MPEKKAVETVDLVPSFDVFVASEMARQAAKRKLIPRPGWIAAARDLSVTYSHLRRVLTGERAGKSLRTKFRAWQRQQRTAPNPESQTAQP